MENTNKCPGCSQHCDLNNLQCGKGEAILRGEAVPSREGRNESHHSRHEHRGEHHGKGCRGEGHGCKHRRPEFTEGSLADLMAKCGHRLFHGGDDSIFEALTEEERTTLTGLLSKLLAK